MDVLDDSYYNVRDSCDVWNLECSAPKSILPMGSSQPHVCEHVCGYRGLRNRRAIVLDPPLHPQGEEDDRHPSSSGRGIVVK